MKRVLMISYAFPPTGGSGVQRAAKFAKYLPTFGWQPVVWSADRIPDLPYDPRLAADLPKEVVRHTSRAVHWNMQAKSHCMRVVREALRERLWNRWGEGLQWRVNRLIDRAAADLPPDLAVMWAARSIRSLSRVIQKRPVHAIWSTYSPASNHLLAWRMKKLFGLPWVADFRDLWTDDFSYAGRSRRREWIDRTLERRILEAADVVVAVTREQREVLAGHLPIQSYKFITITNGADGSDQFRMSQADARSHLAIPASRFVIAYVGVLMARTEPGALIAGVRRCIDSIEAQGKQIEFRVVGTVRPHESKMLRESLPKAITTGYVSHEEAIKNMLAADVLLSGNTTHGKNCSTIIPAKVFEYLATGRPVIHVGTPDGAVDRVLRETGAGVTIEPDAQKVAAAIQAIWSRKQGRHPVAGCPAEKFAPYDRKQLTKQLANLLDSLCTEECGAAETCDGTGPIVVAEASRLVMTEIPVFDKAITHEPSTSPVPLLIGSR